MSNKNWILFINYNDYPCKVGGLEVFNHYLINRLSSKNCIHRYTFCDQIHNSQSFYLHKKKRSRLLKLTGPLFIFFFLLKNSRNIKVIHLSYSRAYWSHWFVYTLAKKILGLKYIVTIHGGGLTLWSPKLPYHLFFKNAEYITGVSHRIIDEYTRRTGREIIYTPPLIPFEVIEEKNRFRSNWGIEKNVKVMLYVGSLKPLKSVDTLIEALGIITIERLQKFNLKVMIIGDGISRNNLEQKVKDLDLKNVVIFLGNVNRNMINQLYNLADFYTICSEFEGLPISLLEAFANCLPCITSDAPGLKELSLNNTNTLLFKTKDAWDYAEKMELLLNDVPLQESLRTKSNSYFKENFSYDILLNEFQKLYDSI